MGEMGWAKLDCHIKSNYLAFYGISTENSILWDDCRRLKSKLKSTRSTKNVPIIRAMENLFVNFFSHISCNTAYKNQNNSFRWEYAQLPQLQRSVCMEQLASEISGPSITEVSLYGTTSF